jgi:hypothetical protein
MVSARAISSISIDHGKTRGKISKKGPRVKDLKQMGASAAIINAATVSVNFELVH